MVGLGGWLPGLTSQSLAEPTNEEDGDGDVGNLPDIDLAYLRDLLGVLRDGRVTGFTLGNFAVAFAAPDNGFVNLPLAGRPVAKLVEDENQSISSASVAGFRHGGDGFRHPSLWPNQLGKTLQLDGSLK